MNNTLKSSSAFASLTIIIGLSSIVGWFFHIPVLYTFLSHGASMKFNTSLATVLLGASIGLATRNRLVLASFLGLVIIILCLLTLAEYVYNLDFHIDELFLIDYMTDSRIEPPGRMSLYTTITLFVIALGSESAILKRYFFSQIVALIGLLSSYISFVGILYNISGLFSFGTYSAIALPTSLALISASIANLLYTSDKGWLSEMTLKHSAAITTRYSLFYFFLSLPIFIGLFLLMLSKARLPAELAIVVLIVGFAALTLPFAYILLKKLNRSDGRSLQLMEELENRSKELHDNNQELAEKNRELDSLIHIISHDLKTPIAALRGSLDVMEHKLTAQMQTKELQLLAISKRSVNHMNETIQKLSEGLRTRQSTNFNVEKIDLCVLVNEILLDLQSTIMKSNGQVLVDIADCDVYYERIHLHSIIQNLITNALKFCHPERLPVIRISALRIEGGVKVNVTDNGLGIPEKEKQNLFSKYMRFHNHIEGTGVGLYLIKQLLESHGGTIEATSNEFQGTTFTVFLPVRHSA